MSNALFHTSKCPMWFFTFVNICKVAGLRYLRHTNPRITLNHFIQNLVAFSCLSQGGRGWLAFGDRSRIPLELSESAYVQIFATKTSCFTIAGKQATHTHRHVPSNTLFSVQICTMYFVICTGCTKALQKWALQKLYKSSLKALRKLFESSLKALRKLSENSTKAGSTAGRHSLGKKKHN